MFKLIAWAFVIYLAYKFIFELVVPVSKATSQVKEKMREMQQMQEQQAAQQQRYQQQTAASSATQQQKPASKEGDYIDFEEVKS